MIAGTTGPVGPLMPERTQDLSPLAQQSYGPIPD
jgi:hypothetical protein